MLFRFYLICTLLSYLKKSKFDYENIFGFSAKASQGTLSKNVLRGV